MPFFSVIIPTFNRSDLLREALQSVCAQEYTDYEVIVVDDGSTEDIAAVVREFDSRFRCLHQENRGPGAARNLGIAHAAGEYLAFLDSDDLWFPWTLATYRTVIDRWSSPSLIAGSLHYFRGENEVAGQEESRARYDSFRDYLSASSQGLYVGAGQSVVRRDALLCVGGFAEQRVNAEDHDLALRLGAAPGFVYVHSPAMVACRQHAGNASGDVLRTFEGLRRIIVAESEGRYPGAVARRIQRRRIITQHVRPASLALIDAQARRQAWKLYRMTFAWHLRQGRLKYLLGFPCRALLTGVRNGRGKTGGGR
jgi:GT2 family glycosyltransferase